jgi:hypothetical protein
MRFYEEIGVCAPDILLPAPEIDLTRWAVVACDQFTCEPEYWDNVQQIVGSHSSTYHLVLPEVYLGTPEETRRIKSTQLAMQDYLNRGIFKDHPGMIYTERTFKGRTRGGVVLALDLEAYDFRKGSQTLIRATEGTILDRLPPRIRIRQGAPIEVPHILVLIDDPDQTVIAPLAANKDHLPELYDFELMLGSGHLQGFSLADPGVEQTVVNSLAALADPNYFQHHYQLDNSKGVLLFAVGDGNHSLATAKSIWESLKPQVGSHHPARYALVEVENVHDAALVFEPIHRVLFGLSASLAASAVSFFGGRLSIDTCSGHAEMIHRIGNPPPGEQVIGVVEAASCQVWRIRRPDSQLAVGSLQPFLDSLLISGTAQKIDYIHGEEVVFRLGSQPGNASFFLPVMDKSDLFKTVILDGMLPRKTFSMGEAREKRFYLECRQITG